MNPLSPAGGETLSSLVPAVVVAGIVLALAINPAARAAIHSIAQHFKTNPLRTYLYGEPTSPDTSAPSQAGAAGSGDPLPDSDVEDTFDYSIFLPQTPPD